MDKKEKWTIWDVLRVLVISSLFGIMFLLAYKEYGIKGVMIVLGLCIGMWIAGVLAGGQYKPRRGAETQDKSACGDYAIGQHRYRSEDDPEPH